MATDGTILTDAELEDLRKVASGEARPTYTELARALEKALGHIDAVAAKWGAAEARAKDRGGVEEVVGHALATFPSGDPVGDGHLHVAIGVDVANHILYGDETQQRKP